MYQIEDNVPIPPKAGERSSGRYRYPFDKMSVGDSFAVAMGEKERAGPAAHMYGRRHSMKFATKSAPEKGEYRIWRIA